MSALKPLIPVAAVAAVAVCVAGIAVNPPAAASPAASLIAGAQGTASAGAVTGTVVISKDGKRKSDHSKVVVFLEDAPKAHRAERRHAINQKNKQFAPQVSAIVKGTVVEFPNSDKIFHNVFSASRPARFDLGLYRSGSSKSVTFKRAGVVDVFCNIHPNMVSRVLVLETELFDMTDSKGRFRIDGVPPGTYPVVAWQAYGEPARGTITVTPGKTAVVNLALAEGKKPKQHRRKDGTPYGRYE
jgi:plastocyanin